MWSWFRLGSTGLVGVDKTARVAFVGVGVGVGLAIALQACKTEVCETAVIDADGKRIECGDGPACTPCPSCLDGKKSGDESDVDCGGSCKKKCGNGQSCKVNADCDHDRCAGTQCNSGDPSTCSNSVADGNETDVDCGGPCRKCGVGQSCRANADCDQDRCVGTKCLAAEPSTCKDSTKDGDETDVDCGGSCAKKCGNGQSCKVNADCDHDRCVGTQCNDGLPGTCTDSIKDGDETDVDCGGSCTKKCFNGQSCKVNADCDHDRCVGTVCIQAPTCTDSFKNGDETDVDCGGSCPTKCALGKGCAINGDCTTNNCAGNTCGPPP